MRHRALYFIMIVSLLAGGCAQNGSQDLEIKKELRATRAQVSSLSKEVSSLKSTVTELKVDDSVRDFVDKISHIAYLTPASSGYSVIKVDEGYITVALANVRPYANGSKVTLQFGNPMAATLTNVKMKLEWGTTDAAGRADNADEKFRNVSLLKSLKAGSWTEETFVLDSIPASKLGFVRIMNVSHKGMTLMRAY